MINTIIFILINMIIITMINMINDNNHDDDGMSAAVVACIR